MSDTEKPSAAERAYELHNMTWETSPGLRGGQTNKQDFNMGWDAALRFSLEQILVLWLSDGVTLEDIRPVLDKLKSARTKECLDD